MTKLWRFRDESRGPAAFLFGQERWYHRMFYPLLQSKREHWALKFGGTIYVEPEVTAKSHCACRIHDALTGSLVRAFSFKAVQLRVGPASSAG